MKKTFNLQKHIKKAFYDGDRGYWLRGSRGWCNCLKHKTDGKSQGKQEAYEECIHEYNNWDSAKWLLTYSECYADDLDDRIDKPSGKSKGQQV